MKNRGEWGEFFPTTMSPQAYNDTVAYEYWPLSKEEVLRRGWRWQEERGGTRGKEIESNDLLKKVLKCETCGLNFKYQKKELEILSSFSLPLPLDCPECRFQTRLPRTYTPELFHRTCQCTQVHPQHQQLCTQEFLSPYASDRLELVYCSDCYQAEVL